MGKVRVRTARLCGRRVERDAAGGSGARGRSGLDERTPRADGFVAELDPAGARRWVKTFGGKADDAIAGVAIDATGRVAVAATARDTVRIGATELTADLDKIQKKEGDKLIFKLAKKNARQVVDR